MNRQRLKAALTKAAIEVNVGIVCDPTTHGLSPIDTIKDKTLFNPTTSYPGNNNNWRGKGKRKKGK